MIRRLAGAVAALTLVLLIAAPALAGGWAAIEPDAGTTAPPVEDQPFVLGFMVLQHGQTPAGWETPTVHFTEVATGATFEVVATGSGPDGHFVAEATVPSAGAWTWSVSLKNLATDEIERPLSVAAAAALAPAAVDDVPVAETPARDPATDGVPVAAVLLLGLLAVAIAGLSMARLAGRSAPRTLSPAPTRTPPGSRPG
jgi:hypothetical protein